MTTYARNRASSRRPKFRVVAPADNAPTSALVLADVIAGCAARLEASFPETAILLEIARLDLMARVNGISDEEMHQVALGRCPDAAE